MLEDKTLKELCDLVADSAPTPGGGAVAASVGAMAVALCEMACNVTIKKLIKLDKPIDKLQKVSLSLNKAREQFLKYIDADAEGFKQVITALRLPKSAEQENLSREKALQNAYLTACQIPLQTMILSLDCLILNKTVIENADKFVVSDAYIATHLLMSTMDSAKYNVDINLKYITDTELIDKINTQLNVLSSSCYEIVKKILETKYQPNN
ncbi:MAG: cyclodeaminase/cyclohydrolase family protein [Clostridia bacterium]